MKSDKPPSAAARTLPLYSGEHYLQTPQQQEPEELRNGLRVIRVSAFAAGTGPGGAVLSDHLAKVYDVTNKAGSTLCGIQFDDPQRGGATRDVCEWCRVEAGRLMAVVDNRWPL